MKAMVERDYRVVIRKCPPKVKAFVVKNRAEDYCTIVISSDLDENGRLEAYRHEISHIEHDDFNLTVSVEEAEMRAHAP